MNLILGIKAKLVKIEATFLNSSTVLDLKIRDLWIKL
jgi:hypothetical protein